MTTPEERRRLHKRFFEEIGLPSDTYEKYLHWLDNHPDENERKLADAIRYGIIVEEVDYHEHVDDAVAALKPADHTDEFISINYPEDTER